MAQPTITLLVGPPGSGKTTYANKIVEDSKVLGLESLITYINQDSQGKDHHFELFLQAIKDRKNVIVDRMGFSKKQRSRYLEPARQAKYNTRIVVFHVPMAECIDRCVKRQGHETIKDRETAEKAVDFFFRNYGRVKDEEANEVIRLGWDSPNKEKVTIFDLDGTMANLDHRLHYMKSDPKDYENFFKEQINDDVNEWCDQLSMAMINAGYKVIYVTGRPANYLNLTKAWLEDKDLNWEGYDIYSRMTGDHRQDFQIKEIILDFELKVKYNILFVVDDRAQVVEMWRKNGIICLQCDHGEF